MQKIFEWPELLQNCPTHEITHDWRIYYYKLIPAERVPKELPWGTGMIDNKYLFISDNVPEKYREVILRHEIRCCHLNTGKHGRYALAVMKELDEIPAKEKKDYIIFRTDFFEKLVLYNKQYGNPDIQEEIEKSLEYLKSLQT